jgi:hypothetical protein
MRKIFYSCLPFLLLLFAAIPSHSQTIFSATCNNYISCGVANISIIVHGCSVPLTVRTWYGDGTDSIHSATCAGDTSYFTFSHPYPAPGSYTIKNVLYASGIAVDSNILYYSFSQCTYYPMRLYLDENANCVYDAGEDISHFSNSLRVDSAGIIIDTIPFYNGIWYKAYGPPGTVYDFRVIPSVPGLSVTCPSSGIISETIPAAPVAYPTKYIGLQCGSATGHDLSIVPVMRAAQVGENLAIINVFNAMCASAPPPVTVKFDFSPKYTLGSVYPVGTTYTVSGTSVTFDAGIIPVYGKVFYVRLIPTSPLVLGDTVNSTFTVNPIAGDLYPANNIVIRCDTVRTSWDPNRKSVLPSGYISQGTELEYMLEFENDGNDFAHNVHIMDTLSNFLEFNTLKTGISTHQVDLIQLNDGSNNILKFDFPDIMLPDTAHFPVEECRGMVTFSINAKTTLGSGTTITNRVGIYFDTNPVVMTNTTYSYIPYPSGLSDTRLMKVDLYPNPVNNLLTIKTDGVAYNAATLYNIAGQVLGSYSIDNAEVSIPTNSFAPGIYYVVLRGEAGSKAIKFEKQ